MKPIPILCPTRQRTIERPFGWIPFRLVKSGTFASLSSQAKLLYCFLCIVADRRGLSYYSDYRLTMELKLGGAQLRMAREELCQKDLIAFDGQHYQVLSLPAMKDSSTPAPIEEAPEWLGDILARVGLGAKS